MWQLFEDKDDSPPPSHPDLAFYLLVLMHYYISQSSHNMKIISISQLLVTCHLKFKQRTTQTSLFNIQEEDKI